MNTLYCINCNRRTPRNFADERIFDGIYCERCAPKIVGEPPHARSSVIKPINKESLWQLNLENLKVGLFGPEIEPATMLRYWKAQEAAGYPSASENVRYFADIVGRRQRDRGEDCLENTLRYIRDYLIAIIDEWYRRQDEPNFYEQNIMVYNHVRKELDDLYSFAEKLGVNLDEES